LTLINQSQTIKLLKLLKNNKKLTKARRPQFLISLHFKKKNSNFIGTLSEWEGLFTLLLWLNNCFCYYLLFIIYYFSIFIYLSEKKRMKEGKEVLLSPFN